MLLVSTFLGLMFNELFGTKVNVLRRVHCDAQHLYIKLADKVKAIHVAPQDAVLIFDFVANVLIPIKMKNLCLLG